MFVIKVFYKTACPFVHVDGEYPITKEQSVFEVDTYNIVINDSRILIQSESSERSFELTRPPSKIGSSPINQDFYNFEVIDDSLCYITKVIIENSNGQTVDIFKSLECPDDILVNAAVDHENLLNTD